MNERIRELVRQANEYTNSRVDGPSPIWFECFNKKFAELIVRACAKEAFEFWCMQFDCNENSAQSHILTHFGVEE
jgi:hypothetical protein